MQSGKLAEFEDELVQSFDVIKNCEEVTVNVGELAQNIVRSAQKKGLLFDGNISVFLGNSIILEGLARDLWPEMMMVHFALPYLMSKKIRNYLNE